jgi:protein gp37
LEPLLGPIADWLPEWVIVGGESGKDFRPMNVEWARSLRDACAASGTPFFMKQMAGKLPIPPDLLVRQYPIEVKEEVRYWASIPAGSAS